AQDYIAELKKLKEEGRRLLAGKKNRRIISQHDSLAYFGRCFDVEVVDSIRPFPGIEADAGKIADLVKVCKTKGVRVLTVEPQYSSRNAKLLQSELKNKGVEDVEIVEIDPLETAPGDFDADYYIKTMRKNIETLAKALP